MGCSDSKVSVTAGKSTLIKMWFKYKYTEGADREKITDLWTRMIAHFKKIGSFGPVLAKFSFLHTEDGWEAWELFPSAAAYEKHAKNTMACPFITEVFEMQSQWTEVDAVICGPEDEIAKAPSIAAFYPSQKRIFKNCSIKDELPWHGFMNERDGADTQKSGGNIVFQYEAQYATVEDRPKVDAALQKLVKLMISKGEKGAITTSLRFWHVEGGYKCIQICPAGGYEKHCQILMGPGNEAFMAEMMTIHPMIKTENAGRAFGLKADLDASPSIDTSHPGIEKIYGTPKIEAWGKPVFGWTN